MYHFSPLAFHQPKKPPEIQNWVAGYRKCSRGSPLVPAQQAIKGISNAQRECGSPLELIFCFFSSSLYLRPSPQQSPCGSNSSPEEPKLKRGTLLRNPWNSGPRRVGQTPTDFFFPPSVLLLPVSECGGT